jgi:tetratricopeptide (TPR) repeat protein
MKLHGAQDFHYKFFLGFALITLVISSLHAPMSGDEYVHVEQAKKNINYLKSGGKDKTALNTPISRLKHYGQSFDTFTTYLALEFGINDLYTFRHVCNSLVAWLLILMTSMLSIKITKNRAVGIICIILCLITGRFMGHAMNNLKDIPFAFAYILSIYFMFRFLERLPKITFGNIAVIAGGIGISISIRIGGILLFAYFILFTALFVYYLTIRGVLRNNIVGLLWKLCGVTVLIFIVAYFGGMVLWPFGLEHPLTNPLKSMDLMRDYPTTVRQIFEGKLYWSDHFPWYYLYKYLLITLPLVVLLGFTAFLIFVGKLKDNVSIVFSVFLLISFGFPLFYASTSGANVYGGWRQLLFVFPPLAVLSSVGIWLFYEKIKERKTTKIAFIVIFVLLLIYPFRFIALNYPYQYTFFNPLVGGTKGAFGNYELDYYFTSFDKAYKFLESTADDPKIVAANFIIPEYYKGKSYTPKLIDYYRRSDEDWDYAVICNTFISPASLKTRHWPPDNTVYTETVDGVPILAVIKRENKYDLEGFRQIKEGKYLQAIESLNHALENDPKNESVLINLAGAYVLANETDKAAEILERLDQIYPGNESGLDLSGEIKMQNGKLTEACEIFEGILDYNYKFYHAYVNLAEICIKKGELEKAKEYLSTCLRINPFYEPAYRVYGRLLIDSGEKELGEKMLRFKVNGSGKYGN